MLLKTKELQAVLKIGRDKAYSLMHAKSFPSIKIGGQYYVAEDELKKWLKQYAYREFKV